MDPLHTTVWDRFAKLTFLDRVNLSFEMDPYRSGPQCSGSLIFWIRTVLDRAVLDPYCSGSFLFWIRSNASGVSAKGSCDAGKPFGNVNQSSQLSGLAAQCVFLVTSACF